MAKRIDEVNVPVPETIILPFMVSLILIISSVDDFQVYLYYLYKVFCEYDFFYSMDISSFTDQM